jgi:hypothetical protein
LTILGWIPGIIHAMYVSPTVTTVLPTFRDYLTDSFSQLHHLQILAIPTFPTLSQPIILATRYFVKSESL